MSIDAAVKSLDYVREIGSRYSLYSMLLGFSERFLFPNTGENPYFILSKLVEFLIVNVDGETGSTNVNGRVLNEIWGCFYDAVEVMGKLASEGGDYGFLMKVLINQQYIENSKYHDVVLFECLVRVFDEFYSGFSVGLEPRDLIVMKTLLSFNIDRRRTNSNQRARAYLFGEMFDMQSIYKANGYLFDVGKLRAFEGILSAPLCDIKAFLKSFNSREPYCLLARHQLWRYPFLRMPDDRFLLISRDALSTPRLVYLYDLMKVEFGDSFSLVFTRQFERFVGFYLRECGIFSKVLDESELLNDGVVSSGESVVDFVAFRNEQWFIFESKGVELSVNGQTSLDEDYMFRSMKNSLTKAIVQIHSFYMNSKGLFGVDRPVSFVLTYKSFHLSDFFKDSSRDRDGLMDALGKKGLELDEELLGNVRLLSISEFMYYVDCVDFGLDGAEGLFESDFVRSEYSDGAFVRGLCGVVSGVESFCVSALNEKLCGDYDGFLLNEVGEVVSK